MARIGYYAHAHGSGHCRYADYIGSLMSNKITVFTSRDFPFTHAQNVVKLASDVMSDDALATHLLDPPNYLHYAPVGYAPILERARQVLNAIHELALDLFIVDVSVEIAALLRVSSVPYLYRRMPGHRTDPAHEEAYRGALGLLAYYPEFMETPGTPLWVRKKTTYLGFKPESRLAPTAAPSLRESRGVAQDQAVLSVITGFGGADAVERALPDLRRAYPSHFIFGVGDFDPQTTPYLDSHEGTVPDIRPYLQQSDVVVGACGSNLVTEALRSRTPLVPIPCARPYREQEAIAEALQQAELCTSLEDYLSGKAPVQVDEIRLKKVMAHQYPAYFNRVTAATDWRELRFNAVVANSSKTNL